MSEWEKTVRAITKRTIVQMAAATGARARIWEQLVHSRPRNSIQYNGWTWIKGSQRASDHLLGKTKPVFTCICCYEPIKQKNKCWWVLNPTNRRQRQARLCQDCSDSMLLAKRLQGKDQSTWEIR